MGNVFRLISVISFLILGSKPILAETLQAAVQLSQSRALAGNGEAGSIDGVGAAARLNRPHGLAKSVTGVIYFADRGNHQIKSLNSETGEVKTLSGNGQAGSLDGDLATAQFNEPIAVAVSESGLIFVADKKNHKVRQVTSDGFVSTLAGNSTVGFKDGAADAAQFNEPYGVALNADETKLYVADYKNHSIRVIGLVSKQVTTLAGNGTAGFVNGATAEARFNQPYSIKFNGHDAFFVPDQLNHSIRKITLAGEVTTIAGNGTAGFKDAKGLEAQFNNPTGVEIAENGDLFVADRNNERIRKINSESVVTTVAGTGIAGDKEGRLSITEFRQPLGLIFDSCGTKLLVSEDKGNRIKELK